MTFFHYHDVVMVTAVVVDCNLLLMYKNETSTTNILYCNNMTEKLETGQYCDASMYVSQIQY